MEPANTQQAVLRITYREYAENVSFLQQRRQQTARYNDRIIVSSNFNGN